MMEVLPPGPGAGVADADGVWDAVFGVCWPCWVCWVCWVDWLESL